MSARLRLSEEVSAALSSGLPVVALESTIISHGFPYPANLECALEAERIAREEGAVPATIAIVDGEARVGLDRSDLERLATQPGVAKASTRDIGSLMALGGTGATTVAATMAIASRAGVRVFATGGVGGVHRGGAMTLDISADLEELARTRVAVVCAGAKSMLDIGLTLEYLETRGVPVIGYRTDDFPAFYARTSGHAVSARVDDPADIARILQVRDGLEMPGGEVVANPIPPEHEVPRAALDAWIEAALAEAERAGVSGKSVTPFLLARIHELSGGTSERANKELVYNNVRLAARVARAYHQR